MSDTSLNGFKTHLRTAARDIFDRADAHCEQTIKKAAKISSEFLRKHRVDKTSVCLVCVGSLGRREALQSSDIDLIPVLRTRSDVEKFLPFDQDLRKTLERTLKIKVSKGEDLTSPISIEELSDPETIGGNKDESGILTKRLLILTESCGISGALNLGQVRKKILAAYATEERTSGRHVLSLCNDVARYYRTLCIEYKAKVDVEDKDWCTRNMKLRHSRKLWYFSNIISITHLAEKHPISTKEFASELGELFETPPYLRLLDALKSSHPIEVGNLLEHFSFFMDFMSKVENREALAKVEHERRYDASLTNPFPALKFNSDALHNSMMTILNSLNHPTRKVVLDWFLM